MAAIRPGRPQQAAAKKQAGAQPAEAAPPPPPPEAPKPRSMTVPAIIIAAALLGGFYLMSKGGGDGGGTTNAEATATTLPAVDGEVVALDPITMNLSGGDILKVGIALQLKEGAPEAEAAVEDPKAFGARALDETISVLGAYTRASLLKPGGLQDAKAKLSARVAAAYHDEVIGVYFTQLVVA